MQVSTLIQYLFGNRRAIVDIANCRHAVWLGMLMVLSAGFAREYDGEDLLHDPWHLLMPPMRCGRISGCWELCRCGELP
jgi:hypothetical protein